MPQRTIRAALVLVLGLAAGSSASAQALTPAQSAAIRQEVRSALETHRQLAAAGKWEALLALYVSSPDFRWVESGVVVARSAEEIRRYLQTLPAGTRIENTYEATEITPLAAGAAEVVTRFQTRVVQPQSRGYSFGGVLTMTFVQRGGGWKILGGHASSPPSPRQP